ERLRLRSALPLPAARSHLRGALARGEGARGSPRAGGAGGPTLSDRVIYFSSRRIECCGVWRSLVAHLLWEQGAGGSNPLTPTTFRPGMPTAAQARRRVAPRSAPPARRSGPP